MNLPWGEKQKKPVQPARGTGLDSAPGDFCLQQVRRGVPHLSLSGLPEKCSLLGYPGVKCQHRLESYHLCPSIPTLCLRYGHVPQLLRIGLPTAHLVHIHCWEHNLKVVHKVGGGSDFRSGWGLGHHCRAARPHSCWELGRRCRDGMTGRPQWDPGSQQQWSLQVAASKATEIVTDHKSHDLWNVKNLWNVTWSYETIKQTINK